MHGSTEKPETFRNTSFTSLTRVPKEWVGLDDLNLADVKGNGSQKWTNFRYFRKHPYTRTNDIFWPWRDPTNNRLHCPKKCRCYDDFGKKLVPFQAVVRYL